MSKTMARRRPKEVYRSRSKPPDGMPAQFLSTHRCPADGKASYRSRKDAIKALKAIRELDHTDKVPCEVYLGPECGQWHLTKKRRAA